MTLTTNRLQCSTVSLGGLSDLGGSFLYLQPVGAGHLRILSLGDTLRFGGAHYKIDDKATRYAINWEQNDGANGYQGGFANPPSSNQDSSRILMRIAADGRVAYWERSPRNFFLAGVTGDTLHTFGLGSDSLTWIRHLIAAGVK